MTDAAGRRATSPSRQFVEKVRMWRPFPTECVSLASMVRPGKRNLAAQGFRIRRTCRRIRISLSGLQPCKPPRKVFCTLPKKGEGANCRNSVLAELQRPTADNAQYAAISSFSPDSWLTTAAFPHLKCLLPSPCMTHVTRFCFLNVLCISLHRAVLFQDAMSTIRSTTSCLNSGDSVIK